jgi:hypothetical protein
MISNRFFRWMHKVALFAIVFVSLAPSISHALASHGVANGFLQEVCSVGGQKILIQVVTTQGQLLHTALDVKPSQQPTSIFHHLDDCPFCHAGLADVLMPTPQFEVVVLLETIAQHAAEYGSSVVISYPYIHPPSQAPPRL